MLTAWKTLLVTMKHVARQHISGWFSWSDRGRCKRLNLLHRDSWTEKFRSAAGGQDFLGEKLNIRGIFHLLRLREQYLSCSIAHFVWCLLSEKLPSYYLRYLSPFFPMNTLADRGQKRKTPPSWLTDRSLSIFFFSGLTLLSPGHSGQFGY